MRLHGFRLKDVGPFADVSVDLDAIPGPLVAICGPNGAGKTLLLEAALCGAQYRDMPNQGAIGDRARGRNGILESWIGDYHFKHLLDAHGTDQVLVENARTRAVLVPQGGVTAFDAWAKKTLLATDLFYSSVFGAQGSTGFLGMTPGPRKAVVLRALGIERVEVLAKRAGEERETAEKKAKNLAERVAEERGRATPVPTAQAALGAAIATLTTTQEEAAQARRLLDEGRSRAGARELAVAAARAHEERAEELRRERLRHVDAREDAQRRRREPARILEVAPTVRAEAAALEERRALVANIEENARACDEYTAREDAALGARLQARDRLARLERQRDAAAGALGEREAVQAAVAQVDVLRLELARAEEAERAAARLAEQADRDVQAAEQEIERARTVIAEQGTRARRADDRATALAGVEEAERRLPELQADEETARAAREIATADVERLRKLLVDGKEQRLQGLRGGLGVIRDHEIGSASFLRGVAGQYLETDDDRETEHAAAPADLRSAEAALEEKGRAWRLADRRLGEAERLAERRPELDAARKEGEDARAKVALAHLEVAEAEELASSAGAQRLRERLSREAIQAAARVLRPRLAEAEKAAARLPELARAEATIAALDEQLVAARGAVDAAQAKVDAIGLAPPRIGADLAAARAELERAERATRRLPAIADADATVRALDEQIAREDVAIADTDGRLVALGPAPAVPPAEDLFLADAAVQHAERAAREAVAAHARAEAALAAAQDAEKRTAGLEEQLRAAEEELADRVLLAKALGRDGLQAMLIDAAGPELTALVNDLLRSCFGNRYTVEIRTTRAKADGKGDKEVCDVLVFDAQVPQDGWREGREFSGGQKVILGEAIALALSALSCRRAGLEGPTLVRDETGAALDEENARAYVAMLRRAAEIVGASKVLFVSHARATWALADARIVVRDGAVSIEDPSDVSPTGYDDTVGEAA